MGRGERGVYLRWRRGRKLRGFPTRWMRLCCVPLRGRSDEGLVLWELWGQGRDVLGAMEVISPGKRGVDEVGRGLYHRGKRRVLRILIMKKKTLRNKMALCFDGSVTMS